MEKKIKIYDTTLRDGAQTAGVSFSVEDKIRITKLLDLLGVHYIESGWPGSNPKDICYFKKIKKVRLKNSKISAFGSTRRKNLDASRDTMLNELLKAETPVITIFGKSWDLHVEKSLECSYRENLDMISESIEFLKARCNELIFDAEHFFDGYKNNPEYAIKTIRRAEEAGADSISLCDTNGGTLTEDIEKIIKSVKKNLSIPFGIHAHNDSDLAVSNSLTAVNLGADLIQGTINGLGERCGNANLCSIIPILSLKKKINSIPENNLTILTNTSRTVSELSNKFHNYNFPFVGDSAFFHKGGIHVSAVLKDNNTYEHISPQTVGNKRSVSVSELSGKSNIIKKMRDLGLKQVSDEKIIRTILKKVKELESSGYSFEGADASFELLCRENMKILRKYFILKGYRVITWAEKEGCSHSEATIKAEIPKDIQRFHGIADPVEHTSADGKGPVEAIDNALRKVLEKFYPRLKEVKLVDYKVRIIDEGSGTASSTRVLIHSKDSKSTWSTVGVSGSIIDASWQALRDSLIYKLLKDEDEIFRKYSQIKIAKDSIKRRKHEKSN